MYEGERLTSISRPPLQKFHHPQNPEQAECHRKGFTSLLHGFLALKDLQNKVSEKKKEQRKRGRLGMWVIKCSVEAAAYETLYFTSQSS